MALTSACNQIPEGKDVVDAVHLQGVPPRQEGEVAQGLSTKETPRFLGVFPKGFVFEHETFDESALEKDLQRVERQLRRRGYYQAKVTAARVVRLGEDRVRVEIEVDPGERVHIRRVRTKGLAELPFDAAEHAVRSIELKANDPFDEDEYEQAKQDVANALADVGYAYVRVAGEAEVDLTDQSAEVTLEVDAGPRATFGEVEIEGLRKVPEGPVRDALQLKEGELYSRRELDLARSALFRLGVFSKVEIEPDLEDEGTTAVPITVKVEETALRSITAGGGATLDVLRLSAHGQVGWAHRNFFGGLRKFSISVRPGVTFFPTRVDNMVAPTRVLPENSLTVRLEQPSFIEGRTKGFVETNYNIYPLLFPLPDEADPSEERIVGYNEVGTAVGAERMFFGRRLPITLSMNWRSNFPFSYQGQLVDGLERVIVSYPELQVTYDFRDDPIQPTRGFLLSNDLQVALPLGGDVTDVRLQPEARFYVPLDFARKVVFATRFSMGFVLAPDYGSALENANSGQDYTSPNVIQDQHKLLFRAFYSGGPNSNRGYAFRRVGPHGPIGFLVPPGVDCSGPLDTLPSTCLRPLGGFSLWEASAELRWNVKGPWGVVAFVDASDVSSQKATFTFAEPHLSVGPGVRYGSPIGPVRLDLGWRIPGLQKLEDNPDEPLDVSEVPPFSTQNWWEAFAVHILIGEAF